MKTENQVTKTTPTRSSWLPRMQGYEFNDDPRLPASVHSGIVDVVSWGLKFGKVYDQAGDILERFAKQTHSNALLECCSGAAGPSQTLAEKLSLLSDPPKLYMSDLMPQVESMARAKKKFPKVLDFVPESVDANKIPAAYSKLPRVFTTGFHHFNPENAASIIEKALTESNGILILEPYQRNFKSLFTHFSGWPLSFLVPWTKKPFELKKIFLTNAVPVIPSLLFLDGVTSILRTYQFDELEKMIPKKIKGRVTIDAGMFNYQRGGTATYWMATRSKT